MAYFRDAGANAAETTISGELSAFATWAEDIYFYEPDGSAKDLTGLTFYLQLRVDPKSTGADLTYSTANSLSLVADSGSVTSILRIAVTAGALSAYAGNDMIIDLVGVDGSDAVTHYGHGVVSIKNDPVAI